MKLYELADNLRFAQHLGDRKHQISCGHTFTQLAAHVHADNIRRQKVNRLAQHRGLRLDTANSPANNAEAIDHGCM